METKASRRRRKLEELAERYKHKGGLAYIAGETGLSQEHLQQIIDGTQLPPKADGTRSPRGLGDSSARKIESALDLGAGWFDDSWPFELVSQDEYESLSPLQKGFVQRAMVDAIRGLRAGAGNEEAA